jgi:hypothetical protein
METTHRGNRSQSFGHVNQDICYIQKRLNANITLMVYRALIRSIMTYACPTWEFAADIYLMKLQRLENRVLRAISNLYRCTPVRDFHLVFKIPYGYDYIAKLCRRQAEVIRNHENPNVRAIGQGEARHRNIRCLNLAAVKSTTVQVSDGCFWEVNKLRHRLLLNPALTELALYIRTKCQVIFC